MLDRTKVPHFIPDKPAGVDCFEGHSQERLAHSVCDYVKMIDAKREGEEDSAEACSALLNPVSVVMDTAIGQKVQKLVVLGQDYTEPLSDTRNLIASLLEKVIIAQARYQGIDSPTILSYVRMDNNVPVIADLAFENAVTGDILFQGKEGIERISCENFEMKR